MGRAYAGEIEALPATYEWATKVNVEPLAKAVSTTLELPVVAFGSGGSFTAALLLRNLHFQSTGIISQACTPLEATSISRSPQRFAAWLLSARGRNVDIRRALTSVIAVEPETLGVVCATKGSPLAKEAGQLGYATVFDFDSPAGKDGFLATNSLIATTVCLLRAYEKLPGRGVAVPKTLESLIKTYSEIQTPRNFWKTNDFMILYGPHSEAGAVDMESRFSEAALGSVHLADYRQFAHGRHYWLAKFPKTTSVIALVSPADRELAFQTLQLIPNSVKRIQVDLTSSTPVSQLESIICAILLTSAAGRAKKVDPGRPTVPDFGRAIYNLRAKAKSCKPTIKEVARVSIERKTRKPISDLAQLGQLHEWISYRDHFVNGLLDKAFQAIAFDLDGTLLSERYGTLTPEVVNALVPLLRSSIHIAIATGRGDSAKEVLRASIPKKFWSRITVGYYNGSEIALLSEDYAPLKASQPCERLRSLHTMLREMKLDMSIKISVSQKQITLRAERSGMLIRSDELWHIAQETIHRSGATCLSVVKSSHSVDILAPDVSKELIVARVGPDWDSLVLRIGDMGEWPGNDFELLNSESGLSVDKVSVAKSACWNLLPAGVRGVAGTLHYLQYLRIQGERLLFKGEAF